MPPEPVLLLAAVLAGAALLAVVVGRRESVVPDVAEAAGSGAGATDSGGPVRPASGIVRPGSAADDVTSSRTPVRGLATTGPSAFADSWADEPVDELVGLADLIGVGLMRLDQWLVVRLASEHAHTLLGRARNALRGVSAIEAFGDHRVEVILWTALAQGAASEEVTVGDGNETLLLRARRSRAGGVWLALEDVSELRRLQRIRAEFIDNLSHELRTPLTNVRLLTETLAMELDGSDLPPRIRDGIQKIDVETGHLVQMVTELLDLSRIEQGSSALHFEDVDMAALARASVERVRLFADRHGVGLRTELPGGLPPVRGEEDRLGQLLVNLLHNAIKFSPPGSSVVVRAASRADATGATGGSVPAEREEVVVSVADQGVGIPAGDLERVFERFYKVDKARVRGQGGTGLGLAIARHIAESHGGRIWVESEEGKGSTFSFAIPTSNAG